MAESIAATPAAPEAPAAPAPVPASAPAPSAPATPEKAAPPAAAPVEYKFKLPEGAKLEAKVQEAYVERLRKHGVAPEAAQDFLDFYLATDKQAQEAAEKAHRASVEKQVSEWKAALKANPDIGKDWEGSEKAAAQAVEKFFGPEGAKVLDALDIRYHPQLFAGLVQMGKLLREGSVAGTTDASSGPARRFSQEELMAARFPKMMDELRAQKER